MSEQGEQIKKNFLEQWIRLAYVALYVVVFAFLWPLVALALAVLIILQSLYRVIAAENNETLLAISKVLGNFLFLVLEYVLYINDEEPIDFAVFFTKKVKSSDSDQVAPNSAESSPQANVPEQNVEPDAQESSEKTADDVFADISFTEQPDEEKKQEEDSDSTDFDGLAKKPD